jgi:hypothetical protein
MQYGTLPPLLCGYKHLLLLLDDLFMMITSMLILSTFTCAHDEQFFTFRLICFQQIVMLFILKASVAIYR